MTESNAPEPAQEMQHERREVWREGLTMALYISLSLLAVMAAIPSEEIEANSGLALTIALTALGLVLAHEVAFGMSSRLVTPGSKLEPLVSKVISAQVIGGAAVTLLAVLPILIFGPEAYLWSGALLLLFVMFVGYRVARSAPHGRLRSLAYVAVVVVVVSGVLAVKSLVGH